VHPAYPRAAGSAQHVLTLVQMHRLFVTLPRVKLAGSGPLHPRVSGLTGAIQEAAPAMLRHAERFGGI